MLERDWVEVNVKKPTSFELVYLSDSKRSYIGWWTGTEWFSRHMPQDFKVKYWKLTGKERM